MFYDVCLGVQEVVENLYNFFLYDLGPDFCVWKNVQAWWERYQKLMWNLINFCDFSEVLLHVSCII